MSKKDIKQIFNKDHSISLELYSFLFMLYNLLAFNYIFFEKIYSLSSVLFTFSTFIVLLLLGTICCLILFHQKTVKPLSYLFLIINSSLFYFIKTYRIYVDEEMLRNALQTNSSETMELLNLTWLLYIVFLGIIPIFFIHKLNIYKKNRWYRKVGIILFLFLAAIGIIWPNIKTVAPFIRNNKQTKHLLIPVNYISAIISFTKHSYREHHKFIPIGLNSHFEKYWQNNKKILILFIVGETARAENFSLGSYQRHTNAPLDKYKNNIIYFPHTSSCGTSTAVSLPCMFSKDGRKNFSGGMSYTENILDILQKNNYNVVWIENNSDCKNICNRIKTINPCKQYHEAKECTDKVLVPEIAKSIPSVPQNTVIVLHQIGSHGPKYFKRYPQNYETYQPVCNTEKLNECSHEELINTYDNTIYYTSQNIADIISESLKYQDEYNIIVMYSSDHGESLGEKGLYLHSAPYSIAPQEQTHIPFFFWIKDETLKDLNIDKQCLLNKTEENVTHDNIFHSLLALGGVKTKEYDQNLDLFFKCKK